MSCGSAPTRKRRKCFSIMKPAGGPPRPVATPRLPLFVSISTTSEPSTAMPRRPGWLGARPRDPGAMASPPGSRPRDPGHPLPEFHRFLLVTPYRCLPIPRPPDRRPAGTARPAGRIPRGPAPPRGGCRPSEPCSSVPAHRRFLFPCSIQRSPRGPASGNRACRRRWP